MLLHVNFAENYHYKQQSEIQGAYFRISGFSTFTACCYVKENEELKKHCIAIVTEASNHSRMATNSLILKVIDEVKSQYLHFSYFEKLGIHLWSDGCASKFRSRFVFHLTVFFPESYQLIPYYNQRYHGKDPTDGIGGHIISNIKGVSVLFMPTSDITEEPDFI